MIDDLASLLKFSDGVDNSESQMTFEHVGMGQYSLLGFPSPLKLSYVMFNLRRANSYGKLRGLGEGFKPRQRSRS